MYNKEFDEYIVSQSIPATKSKGAPETRSLIMCWLLRLFSERSTPVKVGFLLCTIFLDIATIISYTALEATILPIVICLLLIANLISTVGTIISLCFSKVPDVCGLEYSEAIDILKRERLDYSIICDDVIVIGQEPLAGKVVRKGIKIKLEVAKFTADGSLKKVNVAFDEIPELDIACFRSSLAMAGQPYSTNRHMTIMEKDGMESDVEVVFTFEFVDNGHKFVIYCEGLYDDKTPDLSFSRLVDGNLEEIEENDWKRIRTLMRYLLYDKEPLRAVRYGRDGVEIL